MCLHQTLDDETTNKLYGKAHLLYASFPINNVCQWKQKRKKISFTRNISSSLFFRQHPVHKWRCHRLVGVHSLSLFFILFLFVLVVVVVVVIFNFILAVCLTVYHVQLIQFLSSWMHKHLWFEWINLAFCWLYPFSRLALLYACIK